MATVPGSSQPILFPARVPPEVHTLMKAANKMEKPLFRKIIKLALGYLQGTLTPEECETNMKQLCEFSSPSVPVTEETVMNISIQYAGIITLLRTALRMNTVTTRQDMLAVDLKNLGLPEEFASDVCKVVYGPARPDIDSQLIASSPSLPHLVKLEWRVEVTISTSWLSRVLEPVVMMRMSTSDGALHTFQVPLSKFHQLRFTVANLLQQMGALKDSPLCKK
ncbi:COMM domain-containing protein 5-like [Penaeus japonicus]|uniref:COMM domain-containing protein 5-like n=1 Tax=Penaeus japonicus TaxID=27405 RepID=UPI001C716368|nr:COMM domain-containing protein 5-like [Penaeus japonicus]XP_042879916.1 COMM domain-containing protein 5-like [Penaeus japonicus]XP_042879999.1 COMM domain-containing protein 5-like [Penaeus japonicus]